MLPTTKITFLGTGTSQGVPVIGCDCKVCQSPDPRDKRLRCSLLVESAETTLVIDIGPDFRQQMLRANVQGLDAVLLTHEHNDHIIGMDDVRPFNFKQRANMPLYGEQRVLDEVKQRFPYVFAVNKYPGAPMIEQIAIKAGVPFLIKELEVLPIRAMHGTLPILGYRIGDFTYLTDFNKLDEENFNLVKGSKTVVLDALHHTEHHSHLTVQQSVALAKRINAGRTYFIHMSHHVGLYREVQATLPPNCWLAYDGLEISES